MINSKTRNIITYSANKNNQKALLALIAFLLTHITFGSWMSCYAKQQYDSPIFDASKMSSYGKRKIIRPTGYFAFGRRYIHAPKVEWKLAQKCDESVRYELFLLQGDKILGVTKAACSPHYIEKGWDKIARGKKAGIVILGLDLKGRSVAQSAFCPIWVAPDFDKRVSSKMKLPYREAAIKAFAALENYKLPASAPPVPPNSGIDHPVLLTAACGVDVCFPRSAPVRHDRNYVEMLMSLNKTADKPLKERILAFAHSVGNHILMCRFQDTSYKYNKLIRDCAGFDGESAVGVIGADKKSGKMQRLVEPGKNGYAAGALVKLYELTGEAEYLDAAVKIAEVLVETQRPDGSWPARVDAKTGEVLSEYSTNTISVASFLDRLNRHRPDKKWLQARDRAVEWTIQNPVKTNAWVVNFDDCPNITQRRNLYVGLSNWDAFTFVRYAADHANEMEGAVKYIEDTLKWTDNNFTFYGSDPFLPFEPYYPCVAEQGSPNIFDSQNNCWVPMDFHTSKWVTALVATYKATGNKIYLEKARAGANTLTQYQIDTGATLTWMYDKTFGCHTRDIVDGTVDDFWPGGTAAASWALAEVAALE